MQKPADTRQLGAGPKASRQASGPARSLEVDTASLYEQLSQLVRLYEFRDRESPSICGLNSTECHALDGICKRPRTVTEIARGLRLNKSSASRIAVSLEKKRLVVRRAHPTDYKARELCATARGRMLNQHIVHGVMQEHRSVLARLSPRERHSVLRVLRELTEKALRRLGDKCGASGCAAERNWADD